LTLIVDDDKISIDELIDQIESWENEIQSVDILSFKEL
jgi:translation elongation factor EF-1beta